MSDRESCCGGSERKVLFYACSGGANVAEASDRAARQLMSEGRGAVFCMAGIAAGIESMIQSANDADLNVVIDGCPMDCARKVFEQKAIANVAFVRVMDLGIEKAAKGTRTTDDEVACVVDAVKQRLAVN